MKKAKSLGLIDNAIKFYLDEDSKKHFFKRVKNRDQTYDIIYSLWLKESPHAKSELEVTVDDTTGRFGLENISDDDNISA